MREQNEGAEPWPPADRDVRETGRRDVYWPGFRGPASQGIATWGSPPTRFGPDQDLAWRVDPPGEGNSSPVVWQDCVLLTAALEPDEPSAPLAVMAFDLASGKPVWQTEVGKALGHTHAKNGHASASVATDGRSVFAFFGSTGLYCLDMDGHLQWRADLGSLKHIWGTAASPVLFEDLVIQLCDREQDSYLAAFRKSDGREQWRTARRSGSVWSTPVLIDAAQGRTPQLVVNGGGPGEQGAISSYDPRSGKMLWSLEGTTSLVAPVALWSEGSSPSQAEAAVQTGGKHPAGVPSGILLSLSGRNGPIIGLSLPQNGQSASTCVRWRINRGGPYIPSSILYRNRVYVLADSGVVRCLNPGDGQQIWQDRLKGSFTASLVAADGRVYAVSEHGVVHIFAAQDHFELLASNPLDDRCLATPAIAGDRLLVRTKKTLYCFGNGESHDAHSPSKP